MGRNWGLRQARPDGKGSMDVGKMSLRDQYYSGGVIRYVVNVHLAAPVWPIPQPQVTASAVLSYYRTSPGAADLVKFSESILNLYHLKEYRSQNGLRPFLDLLLAYAAPIPQSAGFIAVTQVFAERREETARKRKG